MTVTHVVIAAAAVLLATFAWAFVSAFVGAFLSTLRQRREMMKAREKLAGPNADLLCLLNRIAKLGPECREMSRALLTLDPADAHHALDTYDGADEDDRAEMRSFCDGGGPRFCRELRLKHEDGTPTSADLKGWL